MATKNFVSDFGAPTNGADASGAVDAWITFASANDGSTLIIPAYNGIGVNSPYVLSGTNAFTGPLKNATISAESGASIVGAYIGRTNLFGSGFSSSARVDTVAAGATSATVITGTQPNDVQTSAAFLSVGQWVMFGAGGLQGDSFPPNLQYNEFRKLTGISSNTISWTDPLVYAYDKDLPLRDVQQVTVTSASPAVVTWPTHGFSAGQSVAFTHDVGGSLPTGVSAGQGYVVLAAGLTASTFRFSLTAGGAAINTSSTGSAVLGHVTNADLAGPATVYGMAAHFDGDQVWSGLRMTGAGGAFCGAGRSLIIDGCTFDGVGPAPSLGKSLIVRNCQIGSQNEVDKALEYLEYDTCTALSNGQLFCQSSAVTELVIKGGCAFNLNGTPLKTTIRDTCNIDVLIGGPDFFGRGESLTIESTATIGAASPSGTRTATHACPLSDVDDFSAGVFRFTCALNGNAFQVFLPGYKYAVGYTTANLIHTIDNNGATWVFSVLSMSRDATYLYVTTNLAALPGGGITFSGQAANTIFAYGVKTLTAPSHSFLAAIEAFVEPAAPSTSHHRRARFRGIHS